MNRRNTSRLLLGLLALLTVMLVLRSFINPYREKGVVARYDLPDELLVRETFEVDRPSRLVVAVTGSYERAGQPALAAYAWILRRDNHQLAWRMAPKPDPEASGTLVSVRDTVTFQPGVYDIYFTPFGNKIRRNGRGGSFFGRMVDPSQHWLNDQKKWSILVQKVPGEAAVPRKVDLEDTSPHQTPDLVWRTGAIDDNEERTYVFEVKRPVKVHVYSVGEITATERADYGWIQNAVTGDYVWDMTLANTRPAGGAAENRVFEGVVELGPGLYRAFYRTNEIHAADSDWKANPPYDPEGWGLTVRLTDPRTRALVGAFDPWSSRKPLIDLTGMPDEVIRTARFEIKRPLDVAVYGMGEITESGLHDHGWIEKEGQEKKIWEMSREGSEPAGGDEKNRRQTAIIRLEPGTYAARYETDDSHAFGSWNAEEPEKPERWGMAIFALTPTMEEGTFEQLGEIVTERKNSEWGDGPPPPPRVPGDGQAVVQFTRVGNNMNLTEEFTLEGTETLFIRAVGELTERERFDFGWIKRSGTDEVVWEMTYQNTVPAGEKNYRQFSGSVELPAGTYTVRFQTDGRSAYDDFGSDTVINPEAYGITIVRRPERANP